jgi:hypothetical protein
MDRILAKKKVVDRNRMSGMLAYLRERGFGAHGHRCSHHFQNFEDFIISYFYVFKNYSVKYIYRYKQEECMRKSPFKKYVIFWEI